MMLENIHNYYFFTEGVSNMGGAQLLVLRRAKFLKNKGFNVKIVIRKHRGNFILRSKFEGIPLLFVPDFGKPFFCVGASRREQLVKTISLFLFDFQNAIFESHSYEESVWAEYFAGIFKVKHVIYLMSDFPITSFKYFPCKTFFIQKYKRGELWSTSRIGLEHILGQKVDITNDKFINVSFDESELSEISSPPFPRCRDNSFVISTVSRLDKSYIEHLIDACIEICKVDTDNYYDLVIGGGTQDQSRAKYLSNKFINNKLPVNNLSIHFMGYVKLGKDFFEHTDIFVGMGTASINSISQHCATVNIDPFNFNKSSGVFGVDVYNFAYVESEKFEIKDVIMKLCADDKFRVRAQSEGYALFVAEYSVESSFKKTEKLIADSENDLRYFTMKSSLVNIILDRLHYAFSRMLEVIH